MDEIRSGGRGRAVGVVEAVNDPLFKAAMNVASRIGWKHGFIWGLIAGFVGSMLGSLIFASMHP